MPLSKVLGEVFDETYIKNPHESFLGQQNVTFLHFDVNSMFSWVSTYTTLKMLIKKLNFMLVGLHEFYDGHQVHKDNRN
jgi:hypothetical protein